MNNSFFRSSFSVVFFLIFSTVLYSQNNYSNSQIKNFVEEVFCDESNNLVFNNDERYKTIKRFISNIDIQLRVDIDVNKKFDNYLDLPLNNKYNPILQRDIIYSSTSSFNPLKYNAPMFPSKQKIYRLGNTQYLLFINPLN